MSLADRLASEVDGKPGPKCTVCRIIVGMSDEDREALEAALASTMQTSAISRALNGEGYEVRQASVGRHRRGDCSGL